MAISEDMEVGAVAAEVATPVALLREDESSTPLRDTNPQSRDENKHTEEVLQAGQDKRENTGSRDMWPRNTSLAPMT
jgi:hypothetical protein